MRRIFKDELYKRMEKDPSIMVILLDLGYGAFDKIMADFPDRCINVGASEQAGMGIAVGLAYKGKKVFAYSITNFTLYRPFETIRNYVIQENLPICLLGAGRDFDYLHDGPSHHSPDAKAVLEALQEAVPLEVEFKTYFPETKEEIPGLLDEVLANSHPSFISLRR
jgi:transketolase